MSWVKFNGFVLFLVILNSHYLKLEKEKGRNSMDSVIGDREP